MIEIICLLVFALLMRLAAIRGEVQQFDSHGHLYFAKELKTQKQGPFGSIKVKVLGVDYFNHPYLWHWIIGIFPIDFVIKNQKFWNPIIDSFVSILVYLVALKLDFTKNEAFLAYALYLFSPMWFSRLAIGPRINSFTPRLAGEVVSNFFFIVVCLPIGAPYWAIILGGGLLSCFVIATSKFGIQALFFLTPLISIFLGSWLPLSALALGVFIVSIASKLKFLESIKEQFEHLKYYFKKNIKKEMFASNRNRFNQQYKRKKNEPIDYYLARLLKLLTINNSYTGVLLKLPVLWVSIVLFFTANNINAIESIFWAPVFAALILFILINIPQLLFLGEAERYLNHVAFFIIFLGVVISSNVGITWLYWVLVLYGILYLLFEAILIPKISKKIYLKENENKKIINYLSSIKSSVVLSFPFSAGGGVMRIMANTPHSTIFLFISRNDFLNYIEKKYGSKTFFIDLSKLDDMRKEFGINVLVVEQSSVELALGPDWKPSSNWKEINLDLDLQCLYVYQNDEL